MKSAEIRQAFLDFFAERGHQVVPGSSLIPENDATLLFTNAGMVQFKNVFTGEERRPYSRAVSAQRCVRAGGKHNDLENVGYTARHHTFFEMLGNFSFGDYFKRDAILFAWEFLTEILAITEDKLFVTVFQDDDEAARIWREEVGLPAERITRMGEQDNFWSMGDTGPCGPCSEIFYDHGPQVPGGPPGSPEQDGDRFVEIWNLVFMQYQRSADGELHPLPKPSVDTGMGLERISAVMQGVHDNYDIDLFQSLLKKILALFPDADPGSRSLRVIADHIRSAAFLVVDGVIPGNEGQNYVLRRIIRRAVRHGVMLGASGPFLHRMVAALDREMGGAYPELHQHRTRVEAILREEEERFARTLEQGLQLLDQDLRQIDGDTVPGSTIFRLYDTFGFPVDLTADIARERGLDMDLAGYEKAMEEQRDRARSASSFHLNSALSLEGVPDTRFVGYESLAEQGTVLALFDEQDQPGDQLDADGDGIVVLDRTPFYGESGGQVGDRGELIGPNGVFGVRDTVKQGEIFLHRGQMKTGMLRRGDQVMARVADAVRGETALHHSATHLLHAALRRVLGDQVTQKGSLVEASRLRFDFSCDSQPTEKQLREIERLVNQQIRANHVVETRLADRDEALAMGAMALFGEKYGAQVRVLKMGDFSLELCGGTHVSRTGDIGYFKIVSESGIAAGVRRIEAVVGPHADDQVALWESRCARIGALLQASPEEAPAKAKQLVARNRTLEKELQTLKQKLASQAGGDLADQAQQVGDVKVLSARLEGIDPKGLRQVVDQLKQKLGDAVVVLGTDDGAKVSLVAGVTPSVVERVKAGDLVNMVASQVGGKGGGRSDMAMAGGNRPEELPGALASVRDWVADRLGQE